MALVLGFNHLAGQPNLGRSDHVATRNRIADLEKQLNQLEKEMVPMKAKARGKRKFTERAELDSAQNARQDLIRRIGEQKTLLDKINRQLDVMP